MSLMLDGSRMLARAFDPDVEAPPSDEHSERILDAALILVGASGLRHLTMDDVARRARVGRMTVYRRFGSRGELLEALVVREARNALFELGAALDPSVGVEERIAELAVTALRIAREHPLLRRFSEAEADLLLEALRDPANPVPGIVQDFLAAQIAEGRAKGELGPMDPEVTAELLWRLGISFVLMPDSAIPIGDDDSARATTREMLAAILGRR